ncbi:AzlD domain-containing protein [Desulfolucanica intricata]|uniref:AzlD domain-containing protein n=1 Tax=Desulfolucanica intricata TaxID=1285191 RepID=UPI0008374731|nr:AzlD domain-containing protein [Desulfolucanica intricata]
MEAKILVLITGMALANYLPRMLPMVLLSKMDVPPLVIRWLSYVPIAVMAALVTPDIFMIEDQLNLTTQNYNLLASIPAFLVAAKTKSLIYTLLAGMGSMALITYFVS